MITEDYVSFEIAKLLKEKGFDIPLSYYYNSDSKKGYATTYNWNQTTGDFPDYSCPTLQMTMKWLREVRGLNVYARAIWKDVEIQYGNWEEAVVGYDWFIESLSDNSYSKTNTEEPFRTYEEACEAAIKFCLENLV